MRFLQTSRMALIRSWAAGSPQPRTAPRRGKGIATHSEARSQPWAAVVANGTKMATSLVNAVIAVALSVLLAKPLMGALKRGGLLDKLG